MLYMGIYIDITSDLTFVARAQNYVIWAKFTTNHLLRIG